MVSLSRKAIDLFCINKKFLVFNLVSRDLKIKYRRSFLGFFWTVFHPLMLSGVYYLVFKMVMRIEIEHYVPFLLSGIIPWNFFSSSVLEGTETLNGNSGLLTKVPVPAQVFPFVACTTNFVTLVLALPILFVFSLFSGVPLGANILIIPVLFLLLFVVAYSLSLILSIAYVYVRDLKHAMSLIMQLWFYATPVLYKMEMVPPAYRSFFCLNPVAGLFNSFHSIFVGRALDFQLLSSSLLWSVLLFFVATLVSSKWSKSVVEFL